MKSITPPKTPLSHSQKFFIFGGFLFALPSLQWFIQTSLFGEYDTAGILGLAILIGLMIWSAFSPKLSCRQANPTLIISLVVIASILQFLSSGINVNIIRGVSLSLDLYALALWLGLPYRQRPVSNEWLVILLLFSLPIDLPGTGVNTLVYTGVLFAVLMCFARPRLVQSLFMLVMLSGLGVLGSSLRFFVDASGGIEEVIALLPGAMAALMSFFLIYRHPQKPHPFKDLTCWSIPKSVRQDGWWLELPKLQRGRRLSQIALVAFIVGAAVLLVIEFNQVIPQSIPLFAQVNP